MKKLLLKNAKYTNQSLYDSINHIHFIIYHNIFDEKIMNNINLIYNNNNKIIENHNEIRKIIKKNIKKNKITDEYVNDNKTINDIMDLNNKMIQNNGLFISNNLMAINNIIITNNL
jgi:hypothetical protein